MKDEICPAGDIKKVPVRIKNIVKIVYMFMISGNVVIKN